MGGVVELAPQHTRPNQGDPPAGVDLDPFHGRQVDHQAALARAVAGHAVPTAAYGDHGRLSRRPGMLVLSAGERLVIDHATPTARYWLAQIDDGSTEGIPDTVPALVGQALRCPDTDPGGGPTPRTHLLARFARWITVTPGAWDS